MTERAARPGFRRLVVTAGRLQADDLLVASGRAVTAVSDADARGVVAVSVYNPISDAYRTLTYHRDTNVVVERNEAQDA